MSQAEVISLSSSRLQQQQQQCMAVTRQL